MTQAMKKSFTTVIRHEDPIVRDHRVYGVRLLPGVTFLDLIYRTLPALGLSPDAWTLKKVLFRQPVAVAPGGDMRVRVEAERSGDRWNFTVRSRRADAPGSDAAWEENAACELHPRAADAPMRLDLGEYKSRAGLSRDMEDFYGIARSVQIEHFDFMKTRGRVFMNGGSALAELELSPQALAFADRFHVHPSFLDASTLVTIALMDNPQDLDIPQPFIPIFIESFWCQGGLRDKCFALMERSGTVSAASDILHFDIRLFDAQGRLQGEFKRLGAKKVRSRDLITKWTDPSAVRGVPDANTSAPATAAAAGNGVSPAAPHVPTPPPGSGAATHPAPTGDPVDRESIEKDLLSLVAGILPPGSASPDARTAFYELGLQSTDLLMLVRKIESRLGSELYPTLLFEYTNVEELSGYFFREFGARYPLEGVSHPPAGGSPPEPSSGDIAGSLPSPSAAAGHGAVPNHGGVTFHAPGWIPAPFPPDPGKSSGRKGAILVLDTDPERFLRIKEGIKASGISRELILAVPGDTFELRADGTLVLDPGKTEDFQTLFKSLAGRGAFPSDILNLWPLVSAPDAIPTDGPGEDIRLGLLALLNAAKAFTREKVRSKVRLLSACHAGRPGGLALGGFLRTLERENPAFVCGLVGLEFRELTANSLAACLVSELAQPPSAALEVLHVRGERRIRSFTGLTLPPRPHGLPLASGGACIVTGGLGGVGFALAEALAGRCRAKLVIAGRSPLDAGGRMKLDRLTQAGGEAVYVQADIAAAGGAESLVRMARERFGHVSGIVHGAGITADGLIVGKEPDSVLSVLAAKVGGTLHLDAATQGEPLEFFVLLSSISSVFGNPGQGDYAFANAYLDAFAHHREILRKAGTCSGRTLSINWPLWSGVGLGVSREEENQLLERYGMEPLERAEGQEAFFTALSQPQPQVVVWKGALPPPLRTASVKPAKAVYTAAPGDIAIVGAGVRVADARNMDEFWKILKEGRDCIREVPESRWNMEDYFDSGKGKSGFTYGKWGSFIDGHDEFDPLFFNISPQEAETMDPQERIFLETAWQALEDAGYTREQLSKCGRANPRDDVGVFVGVMWNEYQLLALEEFRRGNPVFANSWSSSIPNRISYLCNFHGPSMAVDTMCSSSLLAIHLACESIRRGECRYALAGGVNLSLHPSKYVKMSQMQMLSTDGRCRSFGLGGDGFVPGEGAGALLLKSLEEALADGDNIHAIIRGSTANHGGKTSGFTVPSPSAQADLITSNLRKSGIDPRTLSYVEAHGTGTALGDPIEFSGLTKAFREFTADRGFCALGSLKSNIGHLESAAGVAAVAKVLLQMRHRTLVPTLHAGKPNPKLDLDGSPFVLSLGLSPWVSPRPQDGNAPEAPRRAAVSSFGAGGVNVSLILEEAPSLPRTGEEDSGACLVVLSARNADRLREHVRNLEAFLLARDLPGSFGGSAEAVNGDRLSLADAAYTLQRGREAQPERAAFLVSSWWELAECLQQYLEEPIVGSRMRLGNAKRPAAGGKPSVRAVVEALEARDLPALAGYWVDGAAVDWDVLHRDTDRRRISLPTYPFARERYWLQSGPDRPDSDTVHAEANATLLAPLIHANCSTLGKVRFRTDFTGASRLNALDLFEVALEAAVLGQPGHPNLRFEDAEWFDAHAPGVPICTSLISSGRKVGCEVRVQGNPEGTLLWKAASLAYVSPRTSGPVRVKGNAEVEQGLLDFDALRKTATSRGEPASPDAFGETGAFLDYATLPGGFLAVFDAALGRGAASLPAGASQIGGMRRDEEKSGRILPKGLLEAAYAAIRDLYLEQGEDAIRIGAPLSMASLERLGPLPARIFLHGALRPARKAPPDTPPRIDLVFADSEGRVMLRIRELAFGTAESTLSAAAAQAASGNAEDRKSIGAALAGPLTLFLAGILSRQIKLDPERIDPRESIMDYGLDSVMGMKVVADLESHFGKLDPALLMEFQTLEALAHRLLETHPSESAKAAAAAPSSAGKGGRSEEPMGRRSAGSSPVIKAIRMKRSEPKWNTSKS